jgi:hypothetical protein
MDPFEQLVNVYQTRAAASARSRIDALLDIEQLRDPRVVPFLLEVMADRHETNEVRVYMLKRLRTRQARRAPPDRPLIAQTVGDVLLDASNPDLQLQAALTLGDFTDCEGVLARLTGVALALDALIDLRYAAFTSIERAGPTPDCIAMMRQIANDEALGAAARSVLSAWHVGSP